MNKKSFDQLALEYKTKLKFKFNEKLNNQSLESKVSTMDLVIEELAEIKAQLLEMSLNHEQISGLTFLKSLKYDPMPGISNFSIFSKGDKFDVCSDAIAYNMHSPIKTNQGYLVRWSGPEQIFGMLVRIDRSTDLLISIPILSKATPETNIDLVEIDGNSAEIKKEARRISFILPKRTKNSLGDITNLSFKCSPLASTGEVSVGVCVKYIEIGEV